MCWEKIVSRLFWLSPCTTCTYRNLLVVSFSRISHTLSFRTSVSYCILSCFFPLLSCFDCMDDDTFYLSSPIFLFLQLFTYPIIGRSTLRSINRLILLYFWRLSLPFHHYISLYTFSRYCLFSIKSFLYMSAMASFHVDISQFAYIVISLQIIAHRKSL